MDELEDNDDNYDGDLAAKMGTISATMTMTMILLSSRSRLIAEDYRTALIYGNLVLS